MMVVVLMLLWNMKINKIIMMLNLPLLLLFQSEKKTQDHCFDVYEQYPPPHHPRRASHVVPDLELECTTHSPSPLNPAVHFLGMEISGTGPHVAMTVYDKRRDFPFKVVLYPHASSCIPPSILYGVFTSQLHRFSQICTSLDEFATNTVWLIRQLLTRKYNRPKLFQKLRMFLTVHRPYPKTPSRILALVRARLEMGELP
eukprot:GCRY01002269.1.p1 GENE.GCRY01002269.1~~GCRY01002269.1.p1  ORF type:complete len:200 (+),score=43.24 GCRY01002269.1:599-1198(+)